MVTEEKWNREIRDLQRDLQDTIDNWDFKMDLTDDETEFLDSILFKLMDDLEDAKWEKLQEYLSGLYRNPAVEDPDSSEDSDLSSIDTETERLLDVYAERNRIAQALGRMAMEMKYNVGIKNDSEDNEYVILYIDLPTGQVSWHIPKRELIGEFPEYQEEWDGHQIETKIERVEKYIKNEVE